MREERKVNKAIKQDGIDTQSEVLEELKRRYPQYFEQSSKPAPKRNRRVAVISALTAAAVCAAIVVPCAVLLPNRNSSPTSSNSPNGDETPAVRYCTQDEYSAVDNVDYTIGEYRANNSLNFLYFDWYEVCEERITGCYISNSDNEVLCVKEQVYLPETDEMVQLSITTANVYLSAYDSFIDGCNSEQYVDNHAVKWTVDEWNAMCVFEDGAYRYFIKIKQGQDENRLFELVAELLENN